MIDGVAALDWLPTAATALHVAAERYARAGWPVLQLAEHGKVPVGGHGLLDATTDLAAVRAAWAGRPRANIGVRVPEGFVVVDVDGPAGVESLRSRGSLPRTLTASTARGWHLWFAAPAGVPLRQRAALLPGVDTRTAGRGYLVAAPSVHETGVVYDWVRRLAPAPLPGWLLDLLRAPAAPTPTAYILPALPTEGARRSRYAWRALEGEAEAVARTGEGGRNHRLCAAWLRCTRDLGDVLPRDVVRDHLTRAALAAGLPEPEIRRVLRDELALRGAA